MTGFGEAEQDSDLGRVRVMMRTVNHRYLNVQIRVPNGMDRLQSVLEARLRSRFARGHLTLRVSLDSSAADDPDAVPVDVERARGYRNALRRLQEELGLGGSVDVGLIAAFREVFRAPDPDDDAADLDPELVLELTDRAADQVLEMREAEGARLARDLSGRVDAMEAELETIEQRAPERLVEHRDRLRESVRELLDGQAPVDEERIAREIAHLAERWDIHEEVVRFRSHLAMFRDTLESGSPDGVGKRFGFIAQEILREVNTMGSKANDAQVAAHVVNLKGEVERLREQLENVE